MVDRIRRTSAAEERTILQQARAAIAGSRKLLGESSASTFLGVKHYEPSPLKAVRFSNIGEGEDAELDAMLLKS